jgi:hypothetical protein
VLYPWDVKNRKQYFHQYVAFYTCHIPLKMLGEWYILLNDFLLFQSIWNHPFRLKFCEIYWRCRNWDTSDDSTIRTSGWSLYRWLVYRSTAVTSVQVACHPSRSHPTCFIKLACNLIYYVNVWLSLRVSCYHCMISDFMFTPLTTKQGV